MSEVEVLKIAATSAPKAIAGAMATVIRNNKQVELQAIGAGAVNQAVKAIIIARGYLSPNGIEISFAPSFTNVEIDGEERTALRFAIERK